MKSLLQNSTMSMEAQNFELWAQIRQGLQDALWDTDETISVGDTWIQNA